MNSTTQTFPLNKLVSCILTLLICIPSGSLFADADLQPDPEQETLVVMMSDSSPEHRQYAEELQEHDHTDLQTVSLKGDDLASYLTTISKIQRRIDETRKEHQPAIVFLPFATAPDELRERNRTAPAEQTSVKTQLRNVIKNLTEQGIPVIVPAGDQSMNVNGKNGAVLPAAYDETITFSAIEPVNRSGLVNLVKSIATEPFTDPLSQKQFRLTRYSNYGKNVDLGANVQQDLFNPVRKPLPKNSRTAALIGVKTASEFLAEAYEDFESTLSPDELQREMKRQSIEVHQSRWANDPDQRQEPLLNPGMSFQGVSSARVEPRTDSLNFDVKLSGHRGAGANGKGLAPENTIMAFEKALELGLDSVEFDVLKAKDGFVVFHDTNTEKYTGKDYNVAETPVKTLTTLSPIENYKVVNSKHAVPMKKAKNARIPSLTEVLTFHRENNLHLRIDLKGSLVGNRKQAKQLYRKVKEYGLVSRTTFMSFETNCSVEGRLLRDPRTYFSDEAEDNIRRTCEYPGLSAIEEASDGNAHTNVLWINRNPLVGMEAKNVISYPIEEVMKEMEKQGIDMINPLMPSTVFDFFGPNINSITEKIGLQTEIGSLKTLAVSRHMSIDEFVYEAEKRGLDYAFMAPNNALPDLIRFDVEWINGNRIDKLVRKYEKLKAKHRQ